MRNLFYFNLILILSCTNTNQSLVSSSSEQSSEITGCNEKNYCLTFLTDSTLPGDFAGIEEADSICNNNPNKPENSGTFKAFLVDESTRIACTSENCADNGIDEHVDWVLAPLTEYRRADGETIIATTTTLGLWPSELTHSYADDNNNPNEALRIWTGLSTSYLTHSHTCNSWTDNQKSGSHAQIHATDINAINYSTQLCIDSNYLLCIEQ